jgi:thioesterase domain-containing protein
MRPEYIFSLVLSGMLLASPISARPAVEAPQSGPGRLWSPPPNQQMSRFEREEQRRRLEVTEEEAEAEYGEERLEFARRVAELVEQGKCREARALASEAGERQMALRIRQTCRSRPSR